MRFTSPTHLLFISLLFVGSWSWYGASSDSFYLKDDAGPKSLFAGCAATDSIGPVASCQQNVQVFLDGSGQHLLLPAEIDAGSSDNCGLQSLQVEPALLTCQELGTASAALIVTDSVGLADTCYAVLSVLDTLAPAVNCPAPLSLAVDGNCQVAVPDFTPLPGNILASSTADFSGLQGQGGWFYGSYAAYDYQNFTPLPWFDNGVWFGNQADSTPLIGPSAMMAGADDLAWAVRRWTSDFTGQVSISGAYYDIDDSCTDSLKVRILQNGQEIFSDEAVGSQSTSYSLSTFVQVGDWLDFVIDPDSVVHCDTAYFSVTIQVQSLLQVSDNCGDVILTQSPAAGTLVGSGVHEITIVGTDLSGNTDSCTVLFTALDSLPPLAVCQDLTVSLDANGQYQLSPNEIDGGSSDACGIDSMALSQTAFDCSHRGNPNTLTLYVWDTAAQLDSCTAQLTVVDDAAPTALCRSTVELMLDDNGQAMLSASQVDSSSYDNCEIFSMTVSPQLFDCQDYTGTQATLTLSDLAGNTSSCTSWVYTIDTTAPMAVCQDVQLYLDANGQAVLDGLQLGPNTTDNCALYSLLASPSVYDCSQVGQAVSATLTATDLSGNSSTCTGLVTVLDTVAPQAVCQDVSLQLDAQGQVSLTAAQVDAGSTDACGIASMSVAPNSFSCADLGVNPVVLTVTDGSGNSSSCQAMVTIFDQTAPLAQCQDISLSLDANGTVALIAQQIDGGSTDACGIQNWAASPNIFSCQDIGTNTVVLTVADGSGNSSTCTAVVTVTDPVAPNAVCQDLTVQLQADGQFTLLASAVDGGSTDACGIAEITAAPLHFTCSEVGQNTVTLIVTDNSGNSSSCTATVTVQDNIPPNAVCQSISVQLDAQGQAAILGEEVDGGSSDACGIASYLVVPSQFDCQDIGANTVTLTVTDNNGNTDLCQTTVVVEDQVPPSMSCQNIEIFLDGNGEAQITPAMLDAGSSDACGGLTLSAFPLHFQCDEVGLNAVTLTGTDGQGNQASCTALVTVTDTVPPSPLCQDATVYLDAQGQAPLAASQVDGGSTDACGLASLEVSKNLFSCADLGDNPVVLIVEDNYGNQATCLAVVTVEDPIPPVAFCQNTTLVLDTNGNGVLDPAQVDAGSSDNCGGWQLSLNKATYDCSNVGAQSVQLTITDAFGNQNSCTAQLDVIASAACPPPEISNAGGPTIADPCTCRGNGEFDEEVVIGPTGQGMNWVVASTDLLDPNTLQPYPAGTPFTEVMVGAGQSIYVLAGVHLDGQGYVLTASSAFFPGVILQISNTCYYPQPQITGLDGPFCLYSQAVDLTGEAGGAVLVDSFFTINGNPATVFDPFALGVGTHTVEYTVDAGTAGSNDPSDPGCVALVQELVSIISTPVQMSCNNAVNVGIDANCEALITPDMILEGTYGCYDDYEVSIYAGVNQIPNPVSGAYVGQGLTVQITHLVSGNSCWGTLVVYDNLAPVIDCAAVDTVSISCTQEVASVPPPPAADNCTPVEVLLTEEVIVDDNVCDDDIVRYRRRWIAEDIYGNSSAPCEQIIEIHRPDEVDFPNDVYWSCDQYNTYPNITDAAALHPSIAALQNGTLPLDATGVSNASWLSATGSGLPEGIEGTYCNYGYSFSDQLLASCGNSFDILRTWTVLDWCTNQVILSNAQGEDNVQLIKVVDQTPPDLSISPFTVSANISGAGYQGCTSQDYLFPPTVSDNCNDWTVLIFTPVGEAVYLNGVDGTQGGLIPPPGLPLGTHTITYQAEDACGNVTTVDVEIEVVDDISPVTICKEITTISLPTSGEALTPASVFDNGSLDNCCLDELLVKRTSDPCGVAGNTDFGPSVIFCCADVGAGPVEVTMRAVDCSGNYNECTVQVFVEDNLAPQLLSCPTDVQIDCNTYLDSLAAALALGDYSVLDVYGTPLFSDNCEVDTSYVVSMNINTCSEGSIIRSWSAVDASQNGPVNCTQTIFVEHQSDWVVTFPEDITAQCQDGSLPDFGEPQIFFDDCELIGISSNDQLFETVSDACYKILRTWTVVNWCLYNQYGYDAYPEYSEAQIGQDFDGDGDMDDRTFKDGVNSAGIADGFIQFTQVIKVVDEEDPIFELSDLEVCIEGSTCFADVQLPVPDVLDCSDALSTEITTDLPNPQPGDPYTYTQVPPGNYTATYAISDDCGNTAFRQMNISVVDCKKPTPYCADGLVLVFDQTGEITIWASDFDAGSFDNCSDSLIFSFSSDTADVFRTYYCDLDQGYQPLEIWVTDEAGNQDFCSTFVLLQDNLGVCDDLVVVSGHIYTEEEEMVAHVQVDVNGGAFQELTDLDGQYAFQQLPIGGDYTLSPMLDTLPGNGVSTLDMYYVQLHILQMQPLSSPYKIIAADVNRNGMVSTVDLVYIQQLVLQMIPEFPNNTSWRFVDADYVFPDPENPWQEVFPEVLNYNNLQVDDLAADFIAIKVGDVNSTASTNFDGEQTEFRSTERYPLQLEDLTFESGEEVSCVLQLSGEALRALQFTLEFDKEVLSFEAVDEGPCSGQGDWGLAHADAGWLTFARAYADGSCRAENQTISLRFHTLQAGRLSDVLHLSSSATAAMAFGANDWAATPVLEFMELGDGQGFSLGKLYPNPMRTSAVLPFRLEQPAELVFKVYDLSGHLLYSEKRMAEAGPGSFSLENLPEGVFIYQLETPEGLFTGKGVVAGP